MQFILSGNLLRFVDFRKDIVVSAPTLGEAMSELTQRHPGLRPMLLDNTGQVRGTLRVFLNGEQLSSVSMERSIAENDEITLLTAIAGG
jgi:sulfur-carrier protein adenylyltransferase/sulfurtransferase